MKRVSLIFQNMSDLYITFKILKDLGPAQDDFGAP